MAIQSLRSTFSKKVSSRAVSTYQRIGAYVVFEEVPTVDGGTLSRSYIFNGTVNAAVFACYEKGDTIRCLGGRKMDQMDPALVAKARKKLVQLGGRPR